MSQLLYLEHALVDLTAGRVHRREGASCALTPLEARLLEHLCQRRRTAVSRDNLLRQVWGHAAGASSRTVDRAVVRLRRKIELNPDQPLLIQSVRGEGYRWVGPLPQAADSPPGSAPGAAFVGRLAELDRLRELDDQRRPLLVTGPPGIGKTSLLQAHASAQPADRCVWWLPRAETEQDLLEGLAGLLGLPEHAQAERAERVRAALADRPGALLLVDGPCPRWLYELPGITAWSCGRDLRGEPELETLALGGLDRADGRALLLLAAQALGFVASPEDEPALDQLVDAVGGHPLALRMLAGRVAVWGPAQVAAELASEAPGQTQELAGLERRVALALGEEEPELRDAIARLASFRTGFGASGAQAVGVSSGQLERLLLRSWLRREPPGPTGTAGSSPRFALHEIVRGALPPPEPRVLDQMASFLLGRAAELSRQMDDGDALDARRQALAERQNLLAAFEHLCETGQAELAARLVRIFVDTGFELDLVRRLLDRAIALTPPPAVPGVTLLTSSWP